MTGSLRVKKGYYYIVISYNDEQGKRRQKWVATKLCEKNNKRKAEQMLKEVLQEYQDKNVVITKNILFHRYMTEWLEISKSNVAQTTYQGYSSVVNTQIVPYFKGIGISLQELEPQHIQKFYSKRLKEGISPNTIKHYQANLHKALKYAEKCNLIAYNPADRVDLPKKQKYVGKFYTDEQVNALVTAVNNTEIETAILLALAYGLRRSEIIGIKWDAVDFKQKTITIRHTVTGAGKNLICADKTKNASSYRTLPLLEGVEKHLLELKLHNKEMEILFGNKYIKNDYVCTWDDGRMILPDHLSLKFKTIIKEAQLPKIRFHDLRHTVASLLLADGYNLKEIGELLGHCSIGTTANIYGHLQYKAKIDMGKSMECKLFNK